MTTLESGLPTDPREWVGRHGDYLYRFALAKVRRADAAEDLVQETLLAAWRGRAGFTGEAAERTWLTAILKRKIIDWVRGRVRDKLVTAADAPDDYADGLFANDGHWKTPPGRWRPDDPAGPADRAAFWAALHACVGKLPARLHDVFALRYLDDAAGEAICKEVGITPSNLWVMLHRSRLRVMGCLARDGYGEGSES